MAFFDKDRIKKSILNLRTVKFIKRKAAKHSNSPLPVRILFILLMIGLIAFAVYQGASRITVGMNTLRTQEITDEVYVSLDLYIFRDEQIITADSPKSLVMYSVRDGEKVGVGDVFGTVYSADLLDASEIKNRQNLLDTYYDRIDLLKESKMGTLADAQSSSALIDKNYLALLDAASNGRMEIANGYAEEMLRELDRYTSITGGTLGSGVTVDMLEQARKALVSGLPQMYSLKTDAGGYFYYDTDGYEGIFDYGQVMTMDSAQFSAMKEAVALSNTKTACYGKLVKSSVWYAATYVSHTEASRFKLGAEYVIQISNSAWSEINMTLERSDPDSNGVLLVFSSADMPRDFSFDRHLSTRTISESITGYRVPESSVIELKTDNNENLLGVYVLEGNVVECRLISVVRECNGYYIVKTYDDIMADEELYGDNSTPWEWLGLNDKIITSGNNLYEGKIIS